MLRDQLPASILAVLESHGVADSRILIASRTDIDLYGAYREHWLVVAGERLCVVANGDAPELRFEMELAEASEFRCQPMVGSGLFQARVDGVYVDILRYTNRLSDQFGKIARKLEHHLAGEEIVVTAEEEVDPRRCKSCGMLLNFPGDTCPKCVNRGAVLVRMVRLMKEYRSGAILIMGLLLIGIALDLVSPYLTKYLVDNVLPGSPEAAARLQHDSEAMGGAVFLLVQVVAILAFIQVARMVVNILNGLMASKIGTAITFDMRRRLVSHLQQLSVSYYDRQQVGSLTGRVAYDTEALHGFVIQLTSGFLFQLLMVVGVGVMMFSLNVKLALFTLIPAPFVILGSILFWRHIYPRYYRFWDASSKQAGMLSGVLSGIRVVKAFSQEEREIGRFTQASDYMKSTRRNVEYATSVFNPVMTLVFQAGGWIVWYVGGRNVLEGEMTLGSLMAFFGYLWMFYGPLTTLTQFTNWLTQFTTQAHRIFEILDTPSSITDPDEPVALGVVEGEIEFESVTFGYSRHSPVLRDVSLRIRPGEMIGVVGRSGSGKTTLINLICRFYDVDEGRVLLDGKDLRNVERSDLRHQIGVVLQEPFLFRGSIWENLVYGKPEATPEEVIAASKAANTHDFILRSTQGYDTWVGERGAGLSGGERQRVSIARVLLTDPRVLILDEATSSVDAESEVAIQQALAEVVRNRTTIAIAHRLSTLRNANRILVVDNGRIAEEGSHQELMQKDGLYAHLVHIQGQENMPTVDNLAEQKRAKEEAGATAAGEVGPAGASLLPPVGDFHPRWLQPGSCRLYLGKHGALGVDVPGEEDYGGVFAIRCFPVHHPECYLSLRYFNTLKREVEVGIIVDLAQWDGETQSLVRQSLAKRYFVHTITTVHGIELFNGYLAVRVDTDLGPMEFMMRWRADQAQDYGESGKMLLDTEDNRYLIPNVEELPVAERDLVRKYIYW